jgi:hypothetical protein
VLFPRSKSWLGYVYLESLEAIWIPGMMAIVHQGDSVASQLPDTRSVGAQLCCPQAPLHRAQLGHDLGSLQLANTMFSTRKAIYHRGRYCTISLSTYIASENQSAKPCILSPATVTRRDSNVLVVRDLKIAYFSATDIASETSARYMAYPQPMCSLHHRVSVPVSAQALEL